MQSRWLALAIACGTFTASLAATPPAITVPLCTGLTIVTAVSQRDGDYESIKTVEAVDDGNVRLKYSNERPVQDFPGGPTKLRRLNVSRTIRATDYRNAHSYLQQFQNTAPNVVPGTTAIGTSGAVLAALKTKGEAELSIFDLPASPLSANPDSHPSVFDYQLTTRIRRAEAAPVMLRMIVNDEKVELPAIHVTGDYDGDRAEFYFLDDESNPLALRYRLGIGSASSADQQGPSDRDTLQVIKIAYRCSAPPAGTSRLEQSLAQNKRADVYSIYFSFNSDLIRPESDPTLKELGDLLRRHADWKLTIEGHTDAVGGDEKNLDLSKRRSAAVKTALVTRYQIDASRLATSGFGKSQPKDTNDTAEGRARNRRVELVRE
jgi:outer membrane protein OmpA-like peptidoglycan-associated protein